MNIDQAELLQTILSKLSADEMSWIEARAVLTSLPKPWTTKAWKVQRKTLLAAACASCGTTSPPLVLQHTWHPTPLHKLFYAAHRKHRVEWAAWQESHPLEVDLSALPADEEGCPRCGSTTIRYRKGGKTWVCVARVAGVPCGHVFESPMQVRSPKAVRALERAAAQGRQDAVDEAFGIGRRAVTRALEGQIRYLSLKDTKTLCKRCAFVEDRTRMILCTRCRQNYHAKKYDRCSACAGERNEE